MHLPRSVVRLGAIAAAAVVLAGAAGALGLPFLVRWGIETVGSHELGRALHVERIRVNPFTLRVSLYGLTMADADAAAPPFLQAAALTVNLSSASLWHRAPVIDALAVDGLRVNVQRSAPQRFNFSDIVDRLQAKSAAPTPDAEPARYALHNIELRDGALYFDDRVLNSRHEITDIHLGLPFLSSLPTDAEITVQPAFAARIDGSPIALSGETLPFDDTLESTLQLRLDALDLPSYLPFSPVRLGFEIPRGKLDTDLRIAFRRAVPARDEHPARAAEIVVSGSAALRDFALTRAQQPLVEWQALSLRIGEFAPLTRRLVLDELRLAAPAVTVARDRDGLLNWQRLAQAPLAPEDGRPAAGTGPDKKDDADRATGAAPFAFRLAQLALADGRVRYTDETLGLDQTIDGLALEAQGLDSRRDAPAATLKLAGRLPPQGAFGADGSLQLAPLGGRIGVHVDDVQLANYARVLSQWIDGSLRGVVAVRGRLDIDQADGGTRLALRDVGAELTEIQLRGPRDSGARLDLARLTLAGGEVEPAARRVHAAALALEAPRVDVRRLADGSLGWQRLLRGQGGGDASPSPAAAAAPARADAWAIGLDELTLARGALRFDDASVAPAAAIELTQLQGSLRHLSADGSRRAEVALRSRVGRHGQLALDGGLRWDRLRADLRIDARNLDTAAARGYLAQAVNATLARGDLSSRATLHLTQPADAQAPLHLRVDGNLRLANLDLRDAAGAEGLLRWQTLDVDRVGVALGDGAPQVDVGRVALNAFFARVLLSEDGRLNLVGLLRQDEAAPAAASSDAQAPAPVAAANAADTAVPPPQAAPPRIRIGRIELADGAIDFTDHFVKPNYRANLTGLTGSVSTLASDAAEPATVELAGQIDHDAPVSISGQMNPLAPKLQLDIKGSTKGVDLPAMTPYSAKYAGYPITKGKLSLDVHYAVKDDRLTASNRLFLDQLTFGERVDSPEATKLPVLLAVALLKNGRGEIDIELPIEGSLDDPQFSVGGIIVRVIVNLLTRAVTAPFSLLASAFGGGEELGQVAFAPGRAALDAAQVERLQKLARALNDRPGLRLDIAGRADTARDTPGLRDAQFEERLRAARIRQLLRAGSTAVDPATVTVTEAERPALIAAVYADEPIADKPRILGIARSLPVADKERLIRAHLARTPADLRALAQARAAAVRDWLETTGAVPRERLFVVEPRLDAKDGAAAGVDFSLK